MVKIGIVGAGGIAQQIHLPSLGEMADVRICAICDRNIDRAKEVASRYDIASVYSVATEMLANEDLDAVFVLVWPDQSFMVAYDCLMAGVHVFVEKPAGITLYQSQTLLTLARERGRILQVGFNRRFIPLVRHVLELMRQSSPITQVEGAFFKHSSPAFYGGGADAYVCDVVHAADLIRWIAQAPAAGGALVTGQYGGCREPNAWNAVMRFENDVTGVLKSNYATGGRVHSFESTAPRPAPTST